MVSLVFLELILFDSAASAKTAISIYSKRFTLGSYHRVYLFVAPAKISVVFARDQSHSCPY